MKFRYGLLTVCFCALFTSTNDDVFKPGGAIKTFGKIAAVDSDVEIPKGTVFKVRFDSARGSSKGINSTFDSVARFINLKHAAGVPQKDVQIAIVVHGSASIDVTKNDFYAAKKEGRENGSANAVAELRKHNVEFYICGQSAAYNGIKKTDLLPGVKVAHSAMTIHALLGNDDYLLNPF